MSRPSKACSVWVGNIPYDATEPELTKIFETVGPVKSFKLIFNKETGQPCGYGFAEFHDVETAKSAMRNLNGTEFHGRPLRVDFAEADKNKSHERAAQVEKETITNVAEVLIGMTPTQLETIVAQMKTLINRSDEAARLLLAENPALAHALLQSLFVLKHIQKPEEYLLGPRQGGGGPRQSGRPPAERHLPERPPPGMMYPSPGAGGPVHGLPAQPQAPMQQRVNIMPPPCPPSFPRPASSMVPMSSTPPLMSPAGPVPMSGLVDVPPGMSLEAHEQSLLDQVLSLTPEQIELLNPDQKALIMQVLKRAQASIH